MMVVVVIIALAVICILAREVYAATHIGAKMYIDAQCTTGDESIMLTFDDGPHPVNTPKVLDVLKKHNIKATFFCIASEAEKYPDIVKRIVDEGHTIGQHTYYHNPMHSFYTGKKYLAELKKAHETFEKLGIKIELFRPPLGITNAMIRWATEQMGYKVIGWSVRSFDTRNESREKVLERVVRQLKKGDIVLLHDRMDKADWLAERIIEKIERDL
ncbi:MAG: polysaccharide deacetylase family protein [Bacteroidales bacterium]|nr:polysaccharide deacetylase family protein [Bacteroidales bacterium]